MLFAKLADEDISRKGAKLAKEDAQNATLPYFPLCGLPLRALRLGAQLARRDQ